MSLIVIHKTSAVKDGVPTKFVGICRNGANYFTTATSFEQAKRDLTEQAKKDGLEIVNVRAASDEGR